MLVTLYYCSIPWKACCSCRGVEYTMPRSFFYNPLVLNGLSSHGSLVGGQNQDQEIGFQTSLNVAFIH